MNILLIGNGFDLAHYLPTKYPDFLEYTKVIKQILKMCNGEDIGDINWGNMNIQVKELIELNLGNVRNNLFSQSEMWSNLIGNNIWIEYFLQCSSFFKENWIDFESEICRIIKSIDKDMHRSGGATSVVRSISDSYFHNYFLDNLDERIKSRDEEACLKCSGLPLGEQSKYIENYKQENPVILLKAEITYKDLILRLEEDLNKLIRALEIYLTEYVEKIDIKDFSPDIKNIAIQINYDTHTASIAKVLSFNYTNIFEKLYDKDKSIEYDYIHGKADIRNTKESNNMVLGIDEYLGKKRQNKEVEFIAFKKFYQRIYKQTGCKYKEWIEEIRRNNGTWHNLYIFGHSLDITDKDILRDLILNDNVHTTIFYHNKDVMGQQIANLVKVIGQDELIKRTGGSTKTIGFELQKPMKPINDQKND